MRARVHIIAAALCTLLAVGGGVASPFERVAADHAARFNVAAPSDVLAPARRDAAPRLALHGPIRNIAFVGDSLYFDPAPAGWGPENTIVARVEDALQGALGDVKVRNLSRLGVVIAFPGEAREFGFIPQREHLDRVFQDGQLPDLVVIPASSTDLNLHREMSAAELVPLLVAELRTIEADLARRGVQMVVVPAFGINDEMYDRANSPFLPEPVKLHANRRVRILNAAMARSGLPLLMPAFRGIDADADGIVDEHLFTDYNPQLGGDDGVHPNALGHELMAKQIAARLIEVVSRHK